jgi:hypothetical protein
VPEFTGWVGPSYTLDAVNADCQRTVNLIPEVNEVGAAKERRVARFLRRAGLELVCTAGTKIRGEYTAGNNRVFFVSGTKLYELVGSVATERGTIDSSTGTVVMSDNGTQMILATGGTGYGYTFADNTLAAITDPNFPAATTVDFLDQYMIVDDPDTGNFQISALADGTDWDGLDIASPEGSPDSLVTLLVDHRELLLFGTQTTEIWFNSGDASFPMSRREGAFIQVGIAGKWAKAQLDQGVFFWGQDKNGGPMAYRIAGYNAQRISTHAIEQIVRGYGDISGATCYALQRGGHSYFVTNFPDTDTTWVFDVATGLWHEWQTADGRFRGEFHCFDGQRNLIGDFENGNIYQLSETKYTDNGAYILES